MAKGSNKKGKATKLMLLEKGKVYGRDDEPMPAPVEPRYAYDQLSDVEKEIWDTHYRILEPNGLLTEADGENFANVCRIVAKIREIDEILRDPETKLMISYTEMAPNGTEKPVVKLNPLLPEQRQLMKDLRMYASEFGMTPRGRVGLSVGDAGKKKSKMEELID
jgi:phage terminase small subunit